MTLRITKRRRYDSSIFVRITDAIRKLHAALQYCEQGLKVRMCSECVRLHVYVALKQL